jgi:hypothetical protein
LFSIDPFGSLFSFHPSVHCFPFDSGVDTKAAELFLVHLISLA